MPVPSQTSPAPKAHKGIIERHWTMSRRPRLMFHLISLGLSCLLPAPPTGSVLESSLAAAPRAFTPSHPLAAGGKPLWSPQFKGGKMSGWRGKVGTDGDKRLSSCRVAMFGVGLGRRSKRDQKWLWFISPGALQLGVEMPMNREQKKYFFCCCCFFKVQFVFNSFYLGSIANPNPQTPELHRHRVG